MKFLYVYVIISEIGQTEHRLATSVQTKYRLETSCQISRMKFLELFGVFGHRNDCFTYFQHQILLLLNLDLVHLMSMAMAFKLNSILTYSNQSIQYYSLVCLCIWRIRPCTQSGLILLANQTMHSRWSQQLILNFLSHTHTRQTIWHHTSLPLSNEACRFYIYFL